MADSTGWHESQDALTEKSRDMHRAILSLQEELEAVDWYRQRADACSDDTLRAVLLHNMREEIEHASMVLEWIRRADPDFDANLRTYLFSSAPITEVEAAESGAGAPGPRREPPAAAGHFTVGGMKQGGQ